MVSDHWHHVILPHIWDQANINLDRDLVGEQSLCLWSCVAADYAVNVERGVEKILLQRLDTMSVTDEPVDFQLLSDGGIVEGLLQLREKLTVLFVGNLSVAIEVLDGHLVAIRTRHRGECLDHPPSWAVNPGLVASMYSELFGAFSPGCAVEFEFEVDDSLDAQIHYDFTGAVL